MVLNVINSLLMELVEVITHCPSKHDTCGVQPRDHSLGHSLAGVGALIFRLNHLPSIFDSGLKATNWFTLAFNFHL